MVSSKAPPSSTPQPIESAVTCRQGREAGAGEERLVRNRSAREQPQQQAEDHHPPDADGENGTRLDRVRTVRKAGGDRAESNCYGDQMPTGDHRKAQPAASKASARESLRRHPFQPIAALRALAAVAAIALLAAPAAQAQSDSPGSDQYVPVHPERLGQGQEEDTAPARARTNSGSVGRPGARPDHRRQPRKRHDGKQQGRRRQADDGKKKSKTKKSKRQDRPRPRRRSPRAAAAGGRRR